MLRYRYAPVRHGAARNRSARNLKRSNCRTQPVEMFPQRAFAYVCRATKTTLKPDVQGCLIRCIVGGDACAENCIAQKLQLSNPCANCWVKMGHCIESSCEFPPPCPLWSSRWPLLTACCALPHTPPSVCPQPPMLGHFCSIGSARWRAGPAGGSHVGVLLDPELVRALRGRLPCRLPPAAHR